MADDWSLELSRAGVEWQIVSVLYGDACKRLQAEGKTAFAPGIHDLLREWNLVVADRERIARQSAQRRADAEFERANMAAKAPQSDFEYFLQVGREHLNWNGVMPV